jgi:hypothetical protein
MIARMLAVLALGAVAFGAIACGQDPATDPKVARACKVLEEVVAKARAEKPDPDTMQMWVVMALANEFGGDDEITYLGSFARNADAWTEAACPEARLAIIEITGKSSLQAVVQ